LINLQLVRPADDYLASYVEALRRGWSSNTTRPEAAIDELDQIARDPAAFLSTLDDPEAKAPPVTLPDGSRVARIPGYRRWMWDGEFAGSISFRWQPGTVDLPPHVLGHIGYSVVPWKRGRGYATRALALLLPEVKATGLPYVELTTDPDNVASQRTITANGGRLVERFTKPAAYGGEVGLRFRIDLVPAHNS
jgi:predicted acetyltransferase